MKLAARLFGRVAHGVAVVILGGLVLLAVAAGALSLMLSRGPVDVAWAVRAALAWSGAKHVEIGAATLNWAGWQGGADSPVRLVIRRLDVMGANGAPELTAAEGNATLSAAGLLSGQVQPRTAELRGVDLRARRDADGNWHLQLGEDEAKSSPSNGSGGAGDTLDKLRRLSLHDATMDVNDARFGPWRLAGVDADFTRDDDGGLHGDASLDATVAGVSAHIVLHAAVQPDGASRIDMSTSPIDPAALAAADPAFAVAGALEAPVALSGTLTLDRSLQPLTATLIATAGPGQANLAGGVVRFDSLSVSGEAAWSGGVLARLPRVRLDASVLSPSGGPASRLVLAGSAERQGGRARAAVTVDLDQVRLADFDRLWPPGVAKNARDWITQNITSGTGRDAHIAVTLEAPADLADVQVTAASGQFRGEDATVHWLRPVPPVERVNATITLADPDTINIAFNTSPGMLVERTAAGPLTIGGGSIQLTGLSAAHQFALIDLDIAGTAPATVALLSQPRLHLLSKHKPPFTASSGNSAVHLNLRLPLEKEVSFDDIPIRAEARLTRLRLSGIVAGRNLTDGDLLLQITNDGLNLHGPVTLAGLPGRLGAMLDFRNGPPAQVLQSVTFATRPAVAQIVAAGVPVSGMLTGTPALNVSYMSRRDGAGEVAGSADLTGAGVDVLGWRKAPGAAAHAAVHIVLNHDKLAGVDMLQAEGPGLSVLGQAEMAGGRPTALVIERADIGRTRASGRVVFGTPLRVTATGPVLDASSFVGGRAGPGAAAKGDKGPGTAFVADAAFAQVILGPGRALTGVAAHAESDGGILRRATLETSGPERVTARIAPDRRGRSLQAASADVGALLRVLDVTDRIEIGPATVTGRFDDSLPGSPLTATLDTSRVHILGAAAVGKVLQAVTVYGIADALRGPGLVFSRLQAPFRYADGVLDLTNARLVSASLGATAGGRVDFGRQTVDVTGTIVPAYVVNSLPGRIPLIGRLFTSEKNGGLFAAGFAVRGALDDPSVTINPFTLLAPGALRGLFERQE